jgi:hypothetical protein
VELPAGAAPLEAKGAEIELRPAVEDYAAARRRLDGGTPAPPLASAQPDRTGAFVLVAPGPGCYRVSLRAPGYLPIDLVLAPLVEDRELPPARLVAATPISTRTVGPQGEPLPGVLLVLQDTGWRSGPGPAAAPAWQTAERSGRTGPDGRLELPMAASETPALTVFDPRFLGASIGVPEPATAAGRTGRREGVLRLTAHPALVIEARGPEGRPAGGVLLRLGGRPVGITGSDGRCAVSFESSWAAPALGSPSVESPGGELLGETTWSKARGGVLRIALGPRREEAGELVDAAVGGAVAHGVVWVEGIGPGWPPAKQVLASAAAGADGRFRLRWPAGESTQLYAGAPGCLAARVDLSRGSAPRRVALDRAVDLAGLVVDRSGRAVAGARIAAVEDGSATGPPGPPGAATSGPDGRFRLAGVAAGRHYRLSVTAPGFARASALVRVPAPVAERPATPARIVLEPGRSIVGRLVSPTGEPLAGLAVTLEGGGSGFVPLQLVATAERSWAARSDDRGAFELPHLAPGRYDLVAHGPGFASASRPGIDLPSTDSPLDLGSIVVEAGAACEGVVTDRRARPLAGASVEISPALRGLPTSGVESQGAPEPTRTGADGRFRIPDLLRGQAYDLRVRHEDHPHAFVRGVRVPALEPLRIELADGCGLSGRVVDGDRQPVFGAQVNAVDTGVGRGALLLGGFGGDLGSFDRVAATDAAGVFSLSGLAAGTIDLTVKAEGYRPGRLRGVQVFAGREATPVEIVLDRGSSLTGLIADATGKPRPGALVIAFQEPSLDKLLARDPPSHATAQADEGGRYLLEGMEPGRYQVHVPGGRARPTSVDVQAGKNELDLVAADDETQRVSGRVIDAGGAPVGAATVSLSLDPEGPGTGVSSLSDGSFTFPEVDPGHYWLSASAAGYAPSAEPGPVTVAEIPVDGLEVELRRAEGTIRGRLVGLTREELARTRLTAVLSDSPWLDMNAVAGLIDESGAYGIAGLASGSWLVTALTGSGRRATGRVTLDAGAPEASLDLDFGGGATLSGRVSIDGAPLANAKVIVAARSGADRATVETSTDGAFRVGGLAAGSYGLLVLDARSFAVIVQSLELSGDQAIAVDLTTGEIKGRVVSAGTGLPVADASVTLTAAAPRLPAGSLEPRVSTATDGSFTIAHVVVGAYQVTAGKEGLDPGVAAVVVEPHATAWVQIELSRPDGSR